MNDGKVCVSVCAETADEFIEKIVRAAEVADIIELRFDCAEINEIPLVRGRLAELHEKHRKPFLFTYRPKTQGGKKDLTFKQRRDFWKAGTDLPDTWVDMEIDIVEDSPPPKFSRKICSHHDFVEVPDDLPELFEDLTATNADIVKIAIQTSEITDSLAVWSLLERARSENRQLIPIAMGEAGKWTRILGLAFGSPLTYASLESGSETAPGQMSAGDLIEVYRVRELDADTEIYGIIGNKISHSLSPYLHNAAFKQQKLNSVYIPFEVSNLDQFIKQMIRRETRHIDWNIKGFSVTIPHKESIIKHLDLIDDAANEIGAVNTVKIIDGRLCGYNTDADGFIEPLLESFGDLSVSRVGLIGNGGAARACVYALKKAGAKVTIYARNADKGKRLAEEFGVDCAPLNRDQTAFDDLDILVNTSPLGTTGELENRSPVGAEQFKNLQLAYDLVYNPLETLFLRDAKSRGVKTIGGLEMLIAQATKQFEIWTSTPVSTTVMREAALQKLNESKQP